MLCSFSQSPFEDLTAFRVRHVLLLVSILTSNPAGQRDIGHALSGDRQTDDSNAGFTLGHDRHDHHDWKESW